MHIPDGYMGLETSLPAFGAMVPVWSLALSKLKKKLSYRQLPFLSLCAAFSFVVMMFNIPAGPSAVHAIGAVFIAVMLGPWAACIAVSTALIIQALIFGDGGILAIGANCLNMAFIMPFSGYFVYKLIRGNKELLSRRSIIGIFTGGYIGINAAAFVTAVEFGIQPLLFKTAGGTPLYGFYPLSLSLPVMMGEHLLVAGFVEGFVTAAAVAYVAKLAPQLLTAGTDENYESRIRGKKTKGYGSLISGILILAVLTPVGLLATGTAWGEWGNAEVKNLLGYIPAGFQKLSGIWKAMLPDYSLPGQAGGFFGSTLGYIVSALIGIIAITSVLLLSGRLISKNERDRE